MQTQRKEKEKEVFMAKRCKDLEGLDKKKEEAQVRSHRYRQRMTETYGRTIKDRMFIEW